MICFSWDGFPQYAARCVGAFVKSTSERVVVVATRPDVPIEGMEQCCNCEVAWVERDEDASLKELFGQVPRLMVVSGWYLPVMRKFNREVHAVGGKVVSIVDNNYLFGGGRSLKDNFLELIKAIRYRLFIKRHFDGFFVPGLSGQKLMRLYGAKDSEVLTGVYSADAALFKSSCPLSERPKKIIYVGRFNERKNVLRLVQAFKQLNAPDWTLELYGSGPLKDELESLAWSGRPRPEASNISINSFLQPAELAAKYQEARIFILPSLWEHWGLVVHEAALSGCVLLLSKHVGAADDFLVPKVNGFCFEPASEGDIVNAFRAAIMFDDSALRKAQNVSIELARGNSLEKFAEAVNNFL